MKKQLRWVCKLGAGSLGISYGGSNSVIQVDGVSDMAPACWLSLDGCGFLNYVVVTLLFNLISDGSE